MSIENRKIRAGMEMRAKLIKVARVLFAQGYNKVSTPDIAMAAQVTRGALYHHFRDKQALFEAVVNAVARDIVADVEATATADEVGPLRAVVAGCQAFVRACSAEGVRQIFLSDAPTVLGWKTWRGIDMANGLGSLREGLQACADAGLMPQTSVSPAAHLISGSLNEAAFVLADGGGKEAPHFDTHIEALVIGFISALSR